MQPEPQLTERTFFILLGIFFVFFLFCSLISGGGNSQGGAFSRGPPSFEKSSSFTKSTTEFSGSSSKDFTNPSKKFSTSSMKKDDSGSNTLRPRRSSYSYTPPANPLADITGAYLGSGEDYVT